MTQCKSCGGFCKKSGCERANVDPCSHFKLGLTNKTKTECPYCEIDACRNEITNLKAYSKHERSLGAEKWMHEALDLREERDQLAAALEATSLREAELTAELGDLPEAQADMLATIKRLKADAERYRKAAQMAVEMIETNAHERRHVRWALMEAMKGTS